tara:strand:- start:10561 stop:11097 length:537 start_codon:yes stop_codon:yes gene_type:complete
MHKKIPNIFTFISEFNKEQILRLNQNIGIIFRNYSKNNEKDKILEIKKFCKKNNRQFYLANNLKLAINLNLDGAYIPSFNSNLNNLKYSRKKNFLLLGSAHNIYEIKTKERQGVELIFLSPLFKTKNYDNVLQVIKFNILAGMTKKKIIALGGINKKNLKNLKNTYAYGYSGISYFFK